MKKAIRIPADVHNDVKAMAAERGISIGEAVETILATELDKKLAGVGCDGYCHKAKNGETFSCICPCCKRGAFTA